ncbi:MAG: hypothetical protein JXJ22_08140 [Bacteroidales bacterium]|nr:hypothetical protein [Bacteroidales bacterium]
MNKTVRVLLVIFSIILILLSFVFFIGNLYSVLNIELSTLELSRYGDFMGGFFGTILAGASILILYLTLQSQIKLTKNERIKSDLELINQLINELNADINNLSVGGKNGVECFYLMSKDFFRNPQHLLDMLNTYLISMENLIQIAKNSRYKNKKIKKSVLTRIYFNYYSKILWPVYRQYENNGKTETYIDIKNFLLNEIKHDDSKVILPKYEKISKKCIKYLEENRLIFGKKEHFVTD